MLWYRLTVNSEATEKSLECTGEPQFTFTFLIDDLLWIQRHAPTGAPRQGLTSRPRFVLLFAAPPTPLHLHNKDNHHSDIYYSGPLSPARSARRESIQSRVGTIR